jgi:hypothetical protein
MTSESDNCFIICSLIFSYFHIFGLQMTFSTSFRPLRFSCPTTNMNLKLFLMIFTIAKYALSCRNHSFTLTGQNGDNLMGGPYTASTRSLVRVKFIILLLVDIMVRGHLLQKIKRESNKYEFCTVILCPNCFFFFFFFL